MIEKESNVTISNPYLKKPFVSHSSKTTVPKPAIITKQSPTITKTPTSSSKPKAPSTATIKTKTIGKEQQCKQNQSDQTKSTKEPPTKKPKPKPPTLKSRLKNEIKQIKNEIIKRKREEEAKKKLLLKQQKDEEERRRKELLLKEAEERKRLKARSREEERERKEIDKQERLIRKLLEVGGSSKEKRHDQNGHSSSGYQVISSIPTNLSAANTYAQANQHWLHACNYPNNVYFNYNTPYTSQVNPYPTTNYNQQYMYPHMHNPYGYQCQTSLMQNYYNNYTYPPHAPYTHAQTYPYYGYNNPAPNYRFNLNTMYYNQPPIIQQQPSYVNRQPVISNGVQPDNQDNQLQTTKENVILPHNSNFPGSENKAAIGPQSQSAISILPVKPDIETVPSQNDDNQLQDINQKNVTSQNNIKVEIEPQPPNQPPELTIKSDEEILRDLMNALQSFTLSNDGVILLLTTSSKPFQECMIEYLLLTTLSSYLPFSPNVLKLWSRLSNSIEVEAKRRFEEYWKEYWKLECQAFEGKETIEYMTDAKRSYLRNRPRPTIGCKCGSTTHTRVYSKECILYRDLKFISNYQEEESTINQEMKSTSTSTTIDLHKERAKKRVKLDLEEDYKEAKFVDAMEIVQYQSMQKAIFAPKYLSIMIVSTIVSLRTKLEKNDVSLEDNDNIPLSALATDTISFSQAIKKSILNNDKNAVAIRNVVCAMSRTWGHVYQELPSVEHAWLWHLRTNESNKMSQFQNPRYNSYYLPLETLHFLLNDEQPIKSFPEEHVLSYLISSFRTGIIDELFVLYRRKIISINSNNGEISLYHDWYNKVEQVVIEDMYEQRYYKQELCRKFCLEKSVCDALSDNWKQKDDKSYYRKDNNACFTSLEAYRGEFEEMYDMAMDQKQGIGAFGFM